MIRNVEVGHILELRGTFHDEQKMTKNSSAGYIVGMTTVILCITNGSPESSWTYYEHIIEHIVFVMFINLSFQLQFEVGSVEYRFLFHRKSILFLS